MFVTDETVRFIDSYYYYLITRQTSFIQKSDNGVQIEHTNAYNTLSFIAGIIFKKINEEHKIKVKGNSPFHRKQER